MKRLFFSIALLLASVIWGQAQAPSYMHVPPAKGWRSGALYTTDQAKAAGFEGIVTSICVNATQNPDTTDRSDFKATMMEAARLGLKVHLRLGQDVPLKNSDGTYSWWYVQNGYKTWPTMRPSLKLCPLIATKCWQPALDIAIAAFKYYGRDPLAYLSCEGANEAGVGGAGGAFTTTKFPGYSSSTLQYWPNLPEGTIEPYFAKMLRAIMASFNTRGVKFYALTLEGAYGTVARTEVASIDPTNEDWQWISAHTYGWGFNRYMTAAVDSPDKAGAFYTARANWEISLMQSNPLIGAKPLFNTEFGMKNDPNLMKGATTLTIADYRMGVLKAQRSVLPGGWYTGKQKGSDSQATGFWLIDKDNFWVGGQVGPLLIGGIQ